MTTVSSNASSTNAGWNGHRIDDAVLFEAVIRQDFTSFVAKAFHAVDPGGTYAPNWHIDLISEYLRACTVGEVRRLIINVPPRYLKSICTSVAWPAWLLGHDPTRRIMAASYSQALSLKHSQDCRVVMNSHWFRRIFPSVRLAADQNEKHRFQTSARGFRYATSVGGTATGEGADFLIVDDPHNPRQAASETGRKSALNWFDQTFSTRLNDKRQGVIVVIMQRLHQKDLTGHLLDKGGWEHLCLPAEAEARGVVGFGGVSHLRKRGEPLHEAREDRAQIARAKQDLGAYGFAAQYQQRPAPATNSVVRLDWFQRYRALPAEPLRVVQSWDTAYKPGHLNDPSVCGTWFETERGYYLADVVSRRMSYPELKRTATGLAEKWRPSAVLIEDKSSGQSLIQDLQAETKLPVIPITPSGDKSVRMSVVTPTIESGQVYLPDSASWLLDYESELVTFPNAEHDDQVDMTSQFLKWATERRAEPRIRQL